MADQGYSYDETGKAHRFRYREQVPDWFGMKDVGSSGYNSRQTPAILALGFGFFIPVVLFSFSAAILTGLIGACIGFVVSSIGLAKEGTLRSRIKLSAPPTEAGVVTSFQVEIRAFENGECELNREWDAAFERGASNYQPQRFSTDSIVSIERRSYGDIHVQGYENINPKNYWASEVQKIKHKRELQIKNAECLVFVFETGEELEAGWSLSRNAAAAMQSSVRDFFGGLDQHLAQQQKQAQRAATLDPDDAPL